MSTRELYKQEVIRLTAERDTLGARCERLEEVLRITLGHAALFNRDSDSIWVVIKKQAETALADKDKP